MEHPSLSWIKNRHWGVDFWSVRIVQTRSELVSVRNNVPQPAHQGIDEGAMVFVRHKNGIGYAASSDLSPSGIEAAFARAQHWAMQSEGKLAFETRSCPHTKSVGTYQSPVIRPLNQVSIKERMERLRSACGNLKSDARIVDCEASMSFSEVDVFLVNADGANVVQQFSYAHPDLWAVAHENGQTQLRSLNGHAFARQGGFEIIDTLGLDHKARQISEQAIELLSAENCPNGPMDLILMPDQMMLQIHESIGHPIELDRILGDERNYAGTSFVTLDMFGSYQYGSPLLNVTFDPHYEAEFASYGFDDDGHVASKEYLIKDGILQRPLGGLLSSVRAGQNGVANSRASSWNRPPIDRMANLNIEPGDCSLSQMIESVEYGVVMHANTSWSIDDSRNKFQFGCEYGQLIENGKITKVLRNPNYRGISANFWRSLKRVGNHSTFESYGTPYCGKGEPNQAIRVGHASPACLFQNVEVFGADS